MTRHMPERTWLSTHHRVMLKRLVAAPDRFIHDPPNYESVNQVSKHRWLKWVPSQGRLARSPHPQAQNSSVSIVWKHIRPNLVLNASPLQGCSPKLEQAHGSCPASARRSRGVTTACGVTKNPKNYGGGISTPN